MQRSKEPTYPLALGLLVAQQRAQRVSPTPADAEHDPSLTHELGRRDALRAQIEELRHAAQSAARTLGQANQSLAEQLPKLSKLKAQSQALRQQQEAALVQVEMQRLRRLRAEVNVRVQDLEALAARDERTATTAREQVHSAQRDLQGASDTLRAVDAALAEHFRRQAPLSEVFAALEQRLMTAHAALFVALNEGPTPAPGQLTRWYDTFAAVAEATLDVHDAMAQGRYPERMTLAYRGGRARLCGEVLWGLIALGDWAGAQLAFGRMCGAEAPMHQMEAVFRAHSAGLVLGGEAQLETLASWAALHRFEQTERGALALALWSLLDEDDAALRRAQRTYARAEWQAREREGKPALGLISVTSMGIARLAQERGMAPELLPGPQAPTVALMKLGARRPQMPR